MNAALNVNNEGPEIGAYRILSPRTGRHYPQQFRVDRLGDTGWETILEGDGYRRRATAKLAIFIDKRIRG